MKKRSFDIIIPTCDPGGDFIRLLKGISEQTERPGKVIIFNTDTASGNDIEKMTEGMDPVPEIHHISKKNFNHGRTRNEAVRHSDGEYFICMTQDAVPGDKDLFRKLLDAFDEDEDIGVSYARQLPRDDAGEIERMTRGFNYPERDRVKSLDDLDELGIKTFFCSNVCAAYDRKKFDELGGFPETDFNEDMIYAGRLIKAGGKVKYCGSATVCHSHDLNGFQQFRRNICVGRSQKLHPEVFAGVKSEGEGIRLVLETAAGIAPYKIPYLIYLSACKYLGYRIGKL